MRHAAPLTAADIRAELARRRLPLYKLAAEVSLHPVRLSAALNERRPLSPQLAGRIAAALARLTVARAD
jgi:hypothetical protein